MISATLTRSDLCQGHGGQCDDFDPDMGCMHVDDYDHGVRSYCDGSCSSAHEEWLRELEANPWKAPVSSLHSITLDVRGFGDTPASYRVTFEGPDAEANALRYMDARPGLYFGDCIDAPFHGPAFRALTARLHPTCHHGMAADLCMDPYGDNHFGTLAQELAGSW